MTAYFPFVFLWIIIFVALYEQKKYNVKRISPKRKKRGNIDMSDVFNRYINKDCIIYLSNGVSNIIECNVISVSDNWLTVKTKDGEEIINFDYITRIKEHPTNKNGKKKSIIF